MAANGEWLISVDDHVIEPPNVWVDRLPAKYRELGPHWISDEHGESWLFEGKKRIPCDAMTTSGAVYPTGGAREKLRPLAWSEIPQACYNPKARVEAMNTTTCWPRCAGPGAALHPGLQRLVPRR